MVRSQSFSEPMTLDCELYKRFFPQLGGIKQLEQAGAGYFLSPMCKARDGWSWYVPYLVTQALIILQQVWLWLTSFPSGQTLLRRTKCSGIFQNDSFSSPPARQMHEEIVLQCLLWESGRAPGSKSHVLWGPPVTGSSWNFLVYTEPPAICQL